MNDFKVHPSEFIPEQTIKLSICDAYSPKLWVTQTHFWPLKESNFERIYHVFSEGLSRTLSEVPALIGNVGHNSEDPRDLVINIRNDAHVEFSFEDLSTTNAIPPYSSLKDAGFPMTNLIGPLSANITLTAIAEGSPMMVAKLNKLNGGVALSFGFNHVLTDASAIAEVERMWSLHAADVSSGKAQSHKSPIDDAAIRTRLSAPSVHPEEFNEDHFHVLPTSHSQLHLPKQAESHEAARAMIEEGKKTQQNTNNAMTKDTKWAYWYFNTNSLAKLKVDASGPEGSQWISTMDALVGLFWSRMASMKQSNGKESQASRALFPINVRRRLEPKIDPQYIGNAVDLLEAKCSLSHFEANDTSLRLAAQSLRRAVGGWTQSKWEAWIAKASSLPADQAVCPNPLMLLEPYNIGFNDYSGSNSHLLDWGPELGKIDRTRYMRPAASVAGIATAIIVQPRLPDGGLEVAVTVTDDELQALRKDDAFVRYAEFRSVSA